MNETRINPKGTMKVGKLTVRNGTAGSILVSLENDVLEVRDCCLEEQGR